MSRRVILAAALVAGATTARPEFGTEPTADPFEVVRDGLVQELTLSAERLEGERRHEATKALDRALHLAEFAMSAHGLPGAVDEPFRDAHKAIERARHFLQIGRPELAAMRLVEGSWQLAEASMCAFRAHPVRRSDSIRSVIPI